MLAIDPVLASEVHRKASRPAPVPSALMGRVGVAPSFDRRAPFAEPPERLPEPVEGLRIRGILRECRRERVTRGRPVSPRESLPPLFERWRVDAMSVRGRGESAYAP